MGIDFREEVIEVAAARVRMIMLVARRLGEFLSDVAGPPLPLHLPN